MSEVLILAEQQQTKWRIALSNQASPSEKYAARELQRFLEQISGACFPITTATKNNPNHTIMIGSNDPQFDLERLGDEGFIIRTGDDSLLIAGGKKRGTLYGVYTFLEDYLGCRWFTPEVSKIPTRNQVSIPAIDRQVIPVLESREMCTYGAFPGEWAARNKLNGSHHRLTEQQGDKIRFAPNYVHSFDALVPVDEFFEAHPEYFSEVNGKRISRRTQLCLTNPDVLRITIERVKGWIRENPKVDIVTVSQNDWYNPCQCANCRAIDEQEDSYAGTLLHFVNKVAEAIEDEFPGVAIDTLAYQYTRKAPRFVRPRQNVIVRLGSIECCFSHPLAECQTPSARFRTHVDPDSSFLRDLREWGKISERLYIWDYVTNFAHYLIPFPNFQVLKPNIQLFVENNVKGVFEQGSYSVGGGEEFAELRTYIIAKLLWDPNYDDNLAMDEFLAGFYGSAAPYLKRYIELLQHKVAELDYHLGLYDPPTAEYLSDDLLAEANALFDQAELAADDQEILRRVRRARLSIRYVLLTRLAKGAPGRLQQIDQFFEDLLAERISEIRERTALMTSKKMMEAGELYPGKSIDFFIFG